MINPEIFQTFIHPIQDTLARQGTRAECRRFRMNDKMVGRVIFTQKLLAPWLMDTFSSCSTIRPAGQIYIERGSIKNLDIMPFQCFNPLIVILCGPFRNDVSAIYKGKASA